MRSPQTEFSAPTMALNITLIYRDGSDPDIPKGYYWAMEVGRDNGQPIYGNLHGPHASEEIARNDAREFLAAEIKRLSKGASLINVRQ